MVIYTTTYTTIYFYVCIPFTLLQTEMIFGAVLRNSLLKNALPLLRHRGKNRGSSNVSSNKLFKKILEFSILADMIILLDLCGFQANKTSKILIFRSFWRSN